jgi:shikimate kinase / 3-dehydroquinate synthase
MDDRNLAVTGFMGTGKSAVGQALAQRMGRQFVDTDALIEDRTGLSIPDIFAIHGEAHFRQVEAEVCQELSQRSGLVIATGGWTLGTPENRQALERSSMVVCLLADQQTLIERIARAEGRPMLQAEMWELRLRQLLMERLPTYYSFPLQVDTSGLGVSAVVDRILHYWTTFSDHSLPSTLPVITNDNAYSVFVGKGLLDRVGALTMGHGRWTQMVHASDTVVGPLYSDRLAQSLSESAAAVAGEKGLRIGTGQMLSGEQHKTLAAVSGLFEQFLSAGLDRRGLVLALGGGVVGDVVGFAAASYLRGVSLVQIPTTLLAMVDASVGGKTGVDLPAGKNLVGAFKQPVFVVCDPDVLQTLDPAEMRSGMAEVAKAGVIGSPRLFQHLETHSQLDYDWLVREAVAVKIDVVQTDPFEHGRRAVLNLGHTFGHALETLSGYQIRHGEAVAMGMVVAARLSRELGHCSTDTEDRIHSLLQKLELPTRLPAYAPETIWAAMATDKKARGGELRFVLPRAIGDVGIFDGIPQGKVMETLQQLQHSE